MFHKQDEVLELATLAGGAAQEKFEDELFKVMENILDVNTSEKAVREVTLKLKIRPNNTRTASCVEIICSSKLAPQVAFETQIFHGKNAKGEIKIAEQDLRQMGFNDIPQASHDETPAPSKVTTLR
jgi:hypothetical protein